MNCINAFVMPDSYTMKIYVFFHSKCSQSSYTKFTSTSAISLSYNSSNSTFCETVNQFFQSPITPEKKRKYL